MSYAQKLNDGFSKKISGLQQEGLVDFKMKLRVSEETTTAGIVVVLDNALRLRSEGKAKPYNQVFAN